MEARTGAATAGATCAGTEAPLEPTPDRVAVEAALDRLDQDLRAVVALYYLVDLPVGAVAAELDIPRRPLTSIALAPSPRQSDT